MREFSPKPDVDVVWISRLAVFRLAYMQDTNFIRNQKRKRQENQQSDIVIENTQRPRNRQWEEKHEEKTAANLMSLTANSANILRNQSQF